MNLEKITLIEFQLEDEYENCESGFYAFRVINTETLNRIKHNQFLDLTDNELQWVKYTEYDLTIDSSAKKFLEHIMKAIPADSFSEINFIETADQDAFNEMDDITIYIQKNFTKRSKVNLSLGELTFDYINI
jgi:hypothetical protein